MNIYDLNYLKEKINDYDKQIQDLNSQPKSDQTNEKLKDVVSNLKSIIQNIEVSSKEHTFSKNEDLILKQQAHELLEKAQILESSSPSEPSNVGSYSYGNVARQTEESLRKSISEESEEYTWSDSEEEISESESEDSDWEEEKAKIEKQRDSQATAELVEKFPSLKDRKIREIDLQPIKVLGQGSSKRALQINLLSLKRNAIHTKVVVVPHSLRTRVDERELKTELKINQFLKDIRKSNIPTPHICIGRQVIVRSPSSAKTTTKTVGILMDYYDKGTLENLRKSDPFSINNVFQAATQMAMGLKTLHDNKIVHRDIKEDNFFCSSSEKEDSPLNVFLADYGKSVFINENQEASFSLALSYTPPEVLDDFKNIDFPNDIFALGIVFYNLATGIPQEGHHFNIPNAMAKLKEEGVKETDRNFGFKLGQKIKSMRDEDQQGHLDPNKCDRWPKFKEIPSEEFKQLIREMTDNDPSRRPNIETVLKRCEEISKKIPSTMS